MQIRNGCVRWETTVPTLVMSLLRCASFVRSERELMSQTALELCDPAEGVELGDILLAAEGAEHAREVPGGSDRWAEAPTQVLAGGGAS